MSVSNRMVLINLVLINLVLIFTWGNFQPRCIAETPYKIQYSDPLNQPWRISRFRELEGQGVRCLTEDLAGNMWFGLRDGLVRYDGYQWKHFGKDQGLPPSPVESLTTCKNGNLIAATELGVYQFSGSGWTIIPGTDKCQLAMISFVKETSDETLWIGCSWGLLRIHNGSTTIITSGSYEPCLRQLNCFDHIETFTNACLSSRNAPGTGIRLVGKVVAFLANESPAKHAGLRLGDKILSVDGNRGQHRRTLQREPGSTVRLEIRRRETEELAELAFETQSIPSRIRFPGVHSLMEDSLGRLWVGTMGDRLLRSNDGGATWQRIEAEPQLKMGFRPTAQELSNGDILVVSAGRESAVCRFDGTAWTSKPLSFLTGPNHASCIRETIDGTVWISGLNRFYVRYRNKWVMHDTRDLDLPGEGHRTLVTSDEALWVIGYKQFAARIALAHHECFSLDGLDYQCTDSSGAQWFIENDTERVIRQGADGTVAFDTTDNVISHPSGIRATPNGVVAVGRHGQLASLSVFDGQEWRLEKFPHVATDFNGNSMHITAEGQIWVAASGGKLKNQVGGVVVGDGVQWEHHRPPNCPTTANSIISRDDQKIMVAGGYGIFQFDGGGWSQVNDEMFEKSRVPDMDVDSKGTVWIASTALGLIKNKGNRFESLAANRGLESADVNSVIVGQRDDLWVATSRGTFRFDGTRFQRLAFPPSVGRRSLRLGKGKSIWFDGRHCVFPTQDFPRVSINTRNISVEHGGRAVVALKGVDRWNRTTKTNLFFSTKIDEQEWTPFTNQQILVLNDLTAGEHILQVRARDDDFNVSLNSESVFISVARPYWQAPLFLAMCFAGFATVCWQTYRLTSRGRELRETNLQLTDAQSALENKVAETSALFRSVCDCSPVGIFVADSAARLSYTNRRMREIIGVSSEEDGESVHENGWIETLHPEDRKRVLDGWHDAVSQRVRFHSHGRLVQGGGKTLCFELVADCIHYDGKHSRFVCVLEDVTQRRRSEQELKNSNAKLVDALYQLKLAQNVALQQERVRALGQMAAGVAHDINNSLTPLVTYTELLSTRLSEDDCTREWAELIQLGVSDMADKVSRLDHFYKMAPDREEMRTTDLVELVHETVQLTRPQWDDAAAREGKNVRVQVSGSSSPTVKAHPSQIRCVLTNLIFNSVDSIEQSGTVNLRISGNDLSAVLEVQDDGCGMTKEQLKRCLEPFYTSKANGSGLGLSECHGIVRQHGGSMTIESTLHQGTRVVLEFPQSKAGVENRSDRGDLTTPSRYVAKPTTTVLYVDDQELVRNSAAALLKSMGMQVVEACDGYEALRCMEQSEFQLVITDYGLPGISGGELLKKIKATWPGIPVVIVSGWSKPVPDHELQPDAYLKKPFSFAELSKVLQPYLADSSPKASVEGAS